MLPELKAKELLHNEFYDSDQQAQTGVQVTTRRHSHQHHTLLLRHHHLRLTCSTSLVACRRG